MSSDFLVDFLASILAEEGVADPVGLAKKAALDLRKAKVVDQRRLKTVALHRQIDTLNRQGVSTAMIAVRLSLHRCTVAKIVTDMHRSRKAS